MMRLVLLIAMVLSAPVFGENTTTLMLQADQHYSRRQTPGEVDKAIGLLRRILELDPNHFEAAWRLSKAYWYLGNHAEKPKKRAFFEKGIEAARKAAAINPNDCRGHFWLGVNYGMLAETAGMFEALGMVDDIKEAVEKAQKIDHNCECGGPQRVLGKLYSRAPWFKGGSKDKAIRSLNESLALCPSDTQSRIFLAEIYLDQNKKGLAIQQLKLVLQQEPDSGWIPETNDNKALARKMLDGLEQREVR